MEQQHFDIVIIGAGLAGLSLAYRFCAPQFAHLSIAIVDPRTTFGATHTWSFWQQTAHPFMDLISANRRWRTLWVRAEGVVTPPHDFSAMPYCSIESTHFYKKCLQKMAGNARIHCFYGHHVDGLTAIENVRAAVSATNQVNGERLNLLAKLVFDSRPPVDVRASAWTQAFAGWEVVCDAKDAAPFATLFAANEAVLMDFVPSRMDESGAGKTIPTFIYLLPSSPTQALVQATVFVPPGVAVPTDAALQALALQYLGDKFSGVSFDRQKAEAGRITMDSSIKPSTVLQTITKVGAAGGFVRASTGYSFTRTQRACDALEIAVLRAFPATYLDVKAVKLPIEIHWQSSLARWLDAVFLEAIATPGFDTGQLMARLFATVAPERLVRFLDGNGGATDVLAVMMACPKWVFIRSFFVSLLVCLRRWTKLRSAADHE